MAPSRFSESADLGRRVSQSLGFVVGVCLAALVAFWLVTRVSVPRGGSAICLEAKVNPNTAPVASLIRLPGIGLTRARAIVAYRDRFRRQTGREAAFGGSGDLQQISGIGPKTAQTMAGWLQFD